MSGIAALWYRDERPVAEHEIARMLAAIPYRGPDGSRTLRWESVALGHARFCVTPEDAAEAQPLVSPRTGCAIVADARLDNRSELLARLPGPVWPGVGDAELILRAYEEWGVTAIEGLLGDFAFVIWDPTRQCVVCARDTSGQRALFYRLDAYTLAAASEIQQLLQDPSVSIAPNENRIREYLTPLNVFRNEKDSAETFYAGIRAVPAGHVLVVGRDSVRLARYWEPKPYELRYRRDEDYVDAFRALFLEVLRGRMRTAHPLGALLSGGLDSSTIACSAMTLARSGAAPLPGFTTFTSVFDALDCDERPYIEDMRRMYGFDARYIPSEEGIGRLALAPAGFREAPNMGIGAARDAILGEAQAAGVRVLLTGDIADGCVGGSRFVFDSLLRQGQFQALAHHLRAYRRGSEESWRKIAALYCLLPLLPLPIEKPLVSLYLRRKVAKDWPYLVPTWMPEELRDDLRGRHRRLALAEERGRRFSNEGREVDYRMLYPPEVARHPAPWSLEIWRPFADRRLHEFLLAIPPEQKFAPHPETDALYAGSKQIVRRSMRGILPESIRTRTSKTFFTAVWREELARQRPLHRTAFGPGAAPLIAERGYVHQDAFWERLQTLGEQAAGGDVAYVLRMLELETWLRSLRLPRQRAVTVAPAAAELASVPCTA